MKDKENKIQKVCGLYVNDWHFTTMILPYIRKEIEKEATFIPFFQNSIKANIEQILSKMNLNKKLENKILKMNWNKTIPIKYSLMKQTLSQVNERTQPINILVKGDNKFIETINQNIEKILLKLNIKNRITLINFYDISKNSEVDDITSKHQAILNTAGIRKLEKNTKKDA